MNLSRYHGGAIRGSRSRARGQKEPAGRTKAAILLFLSERGESTFTQVREHMLERYNIRSPKDIRLHLNDLADDGKIGLIVKLSHGNGNACSYRVRDGFGDMKRLYNYLKANGAGPELMRTRLFAEFTSSCDFFVQVKTSLICGIVADLRQRMATAEGRASLAACMGHVPPRARETLVAWMEHVGREETSDPLARSFLELAGATAGPDAEQAVDALVRRIAAGGTAAAGPGGFLALASDVLIPDRYREPMAAIMRASPGAFDGMMNLDCNSPLFPRNPFLAYAISALLARDDPGAAAQVTVRDCCEYAKGLPRVLDRPPIFVIARSHFVADMISGRLVTGEVQEETMRLIFS